MGRPRNPANCGDDGPPAFRTNRGVLTTEEEVLELEVLDEYPVIGVGGVGRAGGDTMLLPPHLAQRGGR